MPHSMYFIAHVLPKELDDRILPIKKDMQARYGCRVGLKSPAHITLIPPYWMHPEKEEELVALLLSVEKGNPFLLRTAGFSAFRPRTIFIALEENEALSALKKGLDRQFPPGNAFGVKVDHRQFHPHITIATRDLSKAQFFEAWPGFEQQPFEAEWIADRISLLRHNGHTWDVIREMPL